MFASARSIQTYLNYSCLSARKCNNMLRLRTGTCPAKCKDSRQETINLSSHCKFTQSYEQSKLNQAIYNCKLDQAIERGKLNQAICNCKLNQAICNC
eukprot:1823908-Amphidinium_carterae.1